MSKDFCLTFLKNTDIITFERVANERKSSFAARFFVKIYNEVKLPVCKCNFTKCIM